jgi:hypothetical protein
MSAGKVIENVILIGGIGAMAYMLLRKPMPKKEECEYDQKYIKSQNEAILLAKARKESPEKIKKLEDEYNVVKTKYDRSQCGKVAPKTVNPAGTIDTSPTPMDIMCAEKKPTIYTDVNLYNRCLENSLRNSELNKPLVDPSVMNSGTEWHRYDATYQTLYMPNGEIKANTCIALDGLIKGLDGSIANSYMWLARGLSNYKPIVETQIQAKADAIAKFNKFNCRDKIEAERTKDLVNLQTQGSIKAEEQIVKPAFSEQKTYIILGALVLLTGFYVVVKK